MILRTYDMLAKRSILIHCRIGTDDPTSLPSRNFLYVPPRNLRNRQKKFARPRDQIASAVPPSAVAWLTEWFIERLAVVHKLPRVRRRCRLGAVCQSSVVMSHAPYREHHVTSGKTSTDFGPYSRILLSCFSYNLLVDRGLSYSGACTGLSSEL